MALIFRTHNLNRARERLERVSSRQKEFQINFVRTQQRNQRFRTTPHIVRGVKEHHGGKGLLHRAYHLKFRVKGDKPSLTRAINNFEPQTKGGKFVQTSAKLTNFIVHDVAQTAVDVSLAGETVGIKSAETATREVKNHYQRKYSREATDDYHKGILFSGRLVFDAVNGTRQHFRLKKQYQLESAKSDVKTAEYQEFQRNFRPKDQKLKSALRENRTAYRSHQKNCGEFVQTKRELKFKRKELKSEKKFKTAEMKNQQKIAKFSKQSLSAVNPLNYSVTRMTASAWQKAVNEDSDNDFMRAADEIKNRVVSPIAQNFTPQARLQREQKKRDKISDKKDKTHTRLIQQEQRLKERNQPRLQRRNRNRPRKSAADKIRENVREIFHFVKNVYVKEVGAFFGVLAVPVLVFFLIFAFLMMIFSSIVSGGGFTLGTYAAQDYDLSQAEKHYTQLAWNFNQNLLKVGNSSNWKNGLKAFGADTSGMKDKPDEWIWGKSEPFNYEPDYDFDCYKLWSFLCAYYYDFDSENGDIKYWKFKDDTKTLLQELFDSEYEFVYWYDNKSRWEELENYNYYGGGGCDSGGSYYRCDQTAYIYDDKPYKYRFKPTAIAGKLKNYKDSDGYICIDSGYRVLNPNDDFAETGLFIMDNRYYSGVKDPFYYIDDATGEYFLMHSGTRYNRSFWGWDSTDAWFMISPTDAHVWNNNLNDVGMYGYYEKYVWKTDCRLYYNVHQKDTFENVILNKLKSMNHADERVNYYNLLLSDDMYGNHQTLKNMTDSDTIRTCNILNGYGYDMQNWNEQHCKISGVHEGIDIQYSANGNLSAPFDCKIAEVIEDRQFIKLLKNDVTYWYDGNGGTKRDTEVYITNAVLTDGLQKGDTITAGQIFAKSTNYQHCDNFENPMSDYVHIKVRIDTDGFGWNYIDPRLVFY